MTILIFLIVSYILLSISLYFLFPLAGESGTKGLIPGVNFITWAKLIGRPAWWAALLLLPIVNIFIYAGMCVDMMRSFGKMGFWDAFLSVVYTPAAFAKLVKDKAEYGGPVLEQEQAYMQSIEAAQKEGRAREVKRLLANNPYKKSGGREWAEAIIFAVFAAAFIRMFLIEAYVIPTPSMEGSLLVGDYLFVSKAHYGIRTPETVLMVPLLHNRLPFVNAESYIEKPSLPAYRFPALENIDHLDPIVFNYPEGDSVYVFPDRVWSTHDVRRGHPGIDAQKMQKIKKKKAKLVTRPIDKRDHYVKRAIGLPGDSLQIKNGQVYIDGEALKNAPKIQFFHRVDVPFGIQNLNMSQFEEWGINQAQGDKIVAGQNIMYLVLNPEQKAKVEAMDNRLKVTKIDYKELQDLFVANGMRKNTLYPHSKRFFKDWTLDNFGPIWIPKAGTTIELTPQNMDMYFHIISHHENNDISFNNGQLMVNGVAATSYTFQQDYYWGMGDNRHSSEDSRYFGFIPASHMVGKPWFIWFSRGSEGIRWNRIFSGAMKMD